VENKEENRQSYQKCRNPEGCDSGDSKSESIAEEGRQNWKKDVNEEDKESCLISTQRPYYGNWRTSKNVMELVEMNK